MHSCTFGKGGPLPTHPLPKVQLYTVVKCKNIFWSRIKTSESVLYWYKFPLAVLAFESLHVCIWRCEHPRFCVEVSLCAIHKFSFIHSSVAPLGRWSVSAMREKERLRMPKADREPGKCECLISIGRCGGGVAWTTPLSHSNTRGRNRSHPVSGGILMRQSWRGKNRFSTYLSDEGGAYGQSLVRVCFVTVPGTDSCHCCAKHWYFYILHNYLLFCHCTTGMKWHLYYLQWACIQFNQSDDAVNDITASHAVQAWWDNYAPWSNSRVGHSVCHRRNH